MLYTCTNKSTHTLTCTHTHTHTYMHICFLFPQGFSIMPYARLPYWQYWKMLQIHMGKLFQSLHIPALAFCSSYTGSSRFRLRTWVDSMWKPLVNGNWKYLVEKSTITLQCGKLLEICLFYISSAGKRNFFYYKCMQRIRTFWNYKNLPATCKIDDINPNSKENQQTQRIY